MASHITSNTITIADDAQFTVVGGNSSLCMVSENNSGFGLAWGFNYSAGNSIIVYDPSSKGSTGNADNKLCLAGQSNSSNGIFINRIGASKSFGFMVFQQ